VVPLIADLQVQRLPAHKPSTASVLLASRQRCRPLDAGAAPAVQLAGPSGGWWSCCAPQPCLWVLPCQHEAGISQPPDSV